MNKKELITSVMDKYFSEHCIKFEYKLKYDILTITPVIISDGQEDSDNVMSNEIYENSILMLLECLNLSGNFTQKVYLDKYFSLNIHGRTQGYWKEKSTNILKFLVEREDFYVWVLNGLEIIKSREIDYRIKPEYEYLLSNVEELLIFGEDGILYNINLPSYDINIIDFEAVDDITDLKVNKKYKKIVVKEKDICNKRIRLKIK